VSKAFKPVATQLQLMSESPRQEADDSTSTADKGLSECPTCGRDDFKSAEGIRQHHARSHGESIVDVELTCEWCGDTYTKNHVLAEKSRFCSKDCANSGFAEERSKESVIVECENCGSSVEKSPSYAERCGKHFCDRVCWDDWRSGENHHNWDGGDVSVSCGVCGGGIQMGEWQAKRSERYFCGVDCRSTWISENLSGEDNPCYIDGERGTYYGRNWKAQRKTTLERDNYKCRACGMSEEECIDEYGTSLSVHHVIPFREFDSTEQANKLANLVTACSSCHRRFEGLPVFPHRKD